MYNVSSSWFSTVCNRQFTQVIRSGIKTMESFYFIIVSFLTFHQLIGIGARKYKDSSPKPYSPPEHSTEAIIQSYGYDAIQYTVTTKDKRELRIFRISPPGYRDQLTSTWSENRPIVMITHGFVCSSSDFVFAGEDEGLGLNLFKKGYDVWLTNLRGNIYGGLKETKKDKSKWDFSFHEMGQYDLPAHIDYILKMTQKEKLFYIGYSMGTTSAYVMLSLDPSYNEKIERMISLAPVVYLKNSGGSFLEKCIEKITDFVGVKVRRLFRCRNPYPRKALPFFSDPCKSVTICNSFLDGMSAKKGDPLYDGKRRKKYWKFSPAGASFKTALHFLQMKKSGDFKPYDYNNVTKHRELYGKDYPENYDLGKVTVPMLLVIGTKDFLTKQEDIEKLKNNLPNAEIDCLKLDGFNHADFIMAKNLAGLLHGKLDTYLKTGDVNNE